MPRAAIKNNAKSPASKVTGRKRKREEDSDDSYDEGDKQESSVSVSEESDDSDSVPESKEEKIKAPPKKKRKFGNFKAKPKEYQVPKKTFDALTQPQRDYLESLSADEMKKKLGLNDQVKTKTKKELMYAIADCVINGCLPRCPKCFGGRLKKSAKGVYFCPGSFDDEDFVACDFESKKVDRPAWKVEPSCIL